MEGQWCRMPTYCRPLLHGVLQADHPVATRLLLLCGLTKSSVYLASSGMRSSALESMCAVQVRPRISLTVGQTTISLLQEWSSLLDGESGVQGSGKIWLAVMPRRLSAHSDRDGSGPKRVRKRGRGGASASFSALRPLAKMLLSHGRSSHDGDKRLTLVAAGLRIAPEERGRPSTGLGVISTLRCHPSEVLRLYHPMSTWAESNTVGPRPLGAVKRWLHCAAEAKRGPIVGAFALRSPSPCRSSIDTFLSFGRWFDARRLSARSRVGAAPVSALMCILMVSVLLVYRIRARNRMPQCITIYTSKCRLGFLVCTVP